MKYRMGFVSNSSSTAYVLDLREPSVKEWAETVKRAEYQGEFCPVNTWHLAPATTPLATMVEAGLSRVTALSVGVEAITEFVLEYIEKYEGLEDGIVVEEDLQDNFGRRVWDLCREHGPQNLVVCRESDEQMGGVFSIPVPLAGRLLEEEYH